MKRLLIYCFLLLLSGTAISQTDAFYFIQFTDPQFGMIEGNKGFSEETKLMEKAVDAINRLNPQFVVVTGDLVHDGKDRKQIEEFKRIINLINKRVPVYLLPGNHDIGQEATDDAIHNYMEDYGYDCFSFQVNNSCFIGINTQIIWAKRTEKEQSQLIWMEKIFENSQKCNHRIVFGHHPFFVNSPDEPDKYQNIPMERRSIYLDLFRKYNVGNMYVGHLHHNAGGKSDKFELTVTSALGMQLGEDKSGLRIVKVYPDKIISEYYDLDNIPTDVTL